MGILDPFQSEPFFLFFIFGLGETLSLNLMGFCHPSGFCEGLSVWRSKVDRAGKVTFVEEKSDLMRCDRLLVESRHELLRFMNLSVCIFKLFVPIL